jgi:membrane fusion protein (multidrug efflux system)
MRKTLFLAFTILALALLGAGGWRWWMVWRFLQSTDDAYVESDTTIISPKVAGYLAEVRVENNAAVKKGEVLFVIDDRDYRAKFAQAEAQLAQAQAVIATDDSRLELQQAVIAEAAATVKSSEADLVQRKADYLRYRALVATDFASRQRFEAARSDESKAVAALAKAQAALAAEEARLTVLQSQRREAAAALEAARAALRLARDDLDYTVIRAPISGVAGNRVGQIGQYVVPGTQLLSLVPLPRVYVTANFKETQLTRMRPGQKATVTVDAYPDEPLEGRVASFAPASGAEFSLLPPDNATGNFTKIVQRVPVRIALPAEGPLARLLRPGLSVEVTVDTRTRGFPPPQVGIVGVAQSASAPQKAAER